MKSNKKIRRRNNNGNDRSGFNGCFYGSLYGGVNAIGSDSLTNIITDTTYNGLFPSVILTVLSLEHFDTPVTIAPVVGKGLDPSARLDVT